MAARHGARRAAWARMDDEALLDVRFRDLGLRLEGTWLEDMLARLEGELSRRGIRLRPHAWLSTEWFSPDHVPGIAFPFYLAHPRLMKLERSQMLEVEGGSRASCLRILRHEAGHAISTAYLLHHQRSWREAFGRFSQHYPSSYRPRPASRDHVVHLDGWYAQAHPAEDFAETFATWLGPRARWREQYADWKVALHKLEVVDALIREHVAGKPPRVRSRARVEDVSRLNQTLREHYRRRRLHHRVESPGDIDRELQRLFSADKAHAHRLSAAVFLRRERHALAAAIGAATGAHAYTIHQLLKDVIERCRVLRLRLAGGQHEAQLHAAALLAVHVLGSLRTRRFEIPL